MREDADAVGAGEALEVDGDRHLVGGQPPGDVEIARCADVEEPVERPNEARARGAAVVLAPGHAHDLEAAAVVQLEELGHQERRGVALEVGRQVGDAKPRPRAGAAPQRRHG
jgi:hypothetical protein